MRRLFSHSLLSIWINILLVEANILDECFLKSNEQWGRTSGRKQDDYKDLTDPTKFNRSLRLAQIMYCYDTSSSSSSSFGGRT